MSSVSSKQPACQTDSDSAYVSGTIWPYAGMHVGDTASQTSPKGLTTMVEVCILPIQIWHEQMGHSPASSPGRVLLVARPSEYEETGDILAPVPDKDASGTGQNIQLNHLQMQSTWSQDNLRLHLNDQELRTNSPFCGTLWCKFWQTTHWQCTT